MDIFTWIIMALLSLDTIRAIIAMLGWVKPDAKYAWIIYGRYSKNIVEKTLKEMGYSLVDGKELTSTGINKKNALKHLIVLLARYTVKFDQPIQYGGRKTTTSEYYIDTMEISHKKRDRMRLKAIMVHLINKKSTGTGVPQIIITPKGGNPLFALEVSEYYRASFLMAKSQVDKSRITFADNNDILNFKINYEGSWPALKSAGAKCIVLDCNTSGGSQLLDIVTELQIASGRSNINIEPPREIFVLFRADDNGDNIDQTFSDHHCKLYRFFDLDEELKKDLYDLGVKTQKDDQAEMGIYNEDIEESVKKIISKMKSKKKLYY